MIRNTNTDEIEIDLVELLGVLLHRWWVILLSAIVCGAMALGYTMFLVDPLYQASALMYVNNSEISVGSTSFSISSSDLSAAQKLVDTYVVILKSRTALDEVKERADLDYSYEELRGMISAAAVNSTEVFEIKVTSKSPQEAEKIANTIAQVLPDKISDIVTGSDVRIVDYAVVPSHRFSPSYTKNTAIGILLGIVLSAGILILIYLLDEVIHSEDDLTSIYPDIPLLAVIPDMISGRNSGGYYMAYQGKQPADTGKKGNGHAK